MTRRVLILLFGLYIFSLFITYYWVLSPMFSYSLLTYHPNLYKLFLSIAIIYFLVITIPPDYEKPSTYLYFILFTIIFIPTANYYWLNDQPTSYILSEAVCFFLIALLIRKKTKAFAIKMNVAVIALKTVFFLYIFACFVLVLHNGGIHFSDLLSNLYAVRSGNRISGLYGYVLNWCAKSFMPLFFIVFYIKKNWLGVALTSCLQAMLFLSYGFKAFLIAVVLLIGVAFLMRKPERFNRNWLLVLILGNFFCLMLAQMISTRPIFLFTYRTLFLPSQGQFEYYDFFTHNPFLYFSEGSLGRLFGKQYPYSETIGRVVNHYIYGSSKNSNGNTGAFSYGFADLGFIGMMLASISIGLVLTLVDASTKRLPVMIPVGAMAYQMITLNDTNFLICLNTGGIFWTIILLILLNSTYNKNIAGNSSV